MRILTFDIEDWFHILQRYPDNILDRWSNYEVRIHKGMDNLHSSVYLCSETQERFMWVCPPSLTPLIVDHYNKVFDLPGVSAGAQTSVIGKIRSDGQ